MRRCMGGNKMVIGDLGEAGEGGDGATYHRDWPCHYVWTNCVGMMGDKGGD